MKLWTQTTVIPFEARNKLRNCRTTCNFQFTRNCWTTCNFLMHTTTYNSIIYNNVTHNESNIKFQTLAYVPSFPAIVWILHAQSALLNVLVASLHRVSNSEAIRQTVIVSKYNISRAFPRITAFQTFSAQAILCTRVPSPLTRTTRSCVTDVNFLVCSRRGTRAKFCRILRSIRKCPQRTSLVFRVADKSFFTLCID